jgi:hypothetical protein
MDSLSSSKRIIFLSHPNKHKSGGKFEVVLKYMKAIERDI